MSDSALPPRPENKTILQRVTQILTGGPKHAAPIAAPVVVQPVESEEKKAERLAAYQKLCEQDAQDNPSTGDAPKKVKYRARDFNASESHAKSKAV